MMHLPVPATEVEDENVISEICLENAWEEIEGDWVDAYQMYRINQGNPLLVNPAPFGSATKKMLYDLYDSRRSGRALEVIRNWRGLISCPVCGSGATGSLDHYLPRAEFQEFSIMRANLVPACPTCNSTSKGTKYKGGPDERLIHPYFDTWANAELWQVKINQPFDAATFTPVALDQLLSDQKKIVTFHLATVLSWQFLDFAETRWARLPTMMLDFGVDPTDAAVAEYIKGELKRATVADGLNSWNSALMRGIASDANAINYLRNKIESVA
jgi:hypothetical protein